MKISNGLRTVAVFEAAKGLLVLLAGFGLLAFVGHNTQHAAEQLVRHMHLNPASHYPRIFIEAAAYVGGVSLWWFALLAAGYAAVRFIEAWGLWYGRRWAEWFAAVSGGIYIPLEVYELFLGITWSKLVVLGVNVGIVAYMIYALWRVKRHAVRT